MASVGAFPDRHVALPEPHGTIRPSEHAFFLDVDGTLLELASTPDAVVVEPEVVELLREWHLLPAYIAARAGARASS